jgi:hypothetical protein
MKKLIGLLAILFSLFFASCINPYLNKAFITVNNNSNFTIKMSIHEIQNLEILPYANLVDEEFGIVYQDSNNIFYFQVENYSPIIIHKQLRYGEHFNVTINNAVKTNELIDITY